MTLGFTFSTIKGLQRVSLRNKKCLVTIVLFLTVFLTEKWSRRQKQLFSHLDFAVVDVLIVLFVMSKKRVCIVVLGDIGRSPRMQYHSLSLIKKGYELDVVGYKESEVLPQLDQDGRCSVNALTSFPLIFARKLKFPVTFK